MEFISTTLLVTKFLKSNDVNLVLANMFFILVTLAVSNPERSMLDKEEHLSNKKDISFTLLVLNLDKSKDLILVTPENIFVNFVTFVVSKLDRSIVKQEIIFQKTNNNFLGFIYLIF